MADSMRHAAWHATYEVRELSGGDPPLDLGRRFSSTSYAEAVEFAFDFLEANDPHREGTVGALEIVRVTKGARDTVWSYRFARPRPFDGDLVRLWGFDPTAAWGVPETRV